MKRLFFFLGFLFLNIQNLVACPICDKRQPKFLKGITHGVGPESNWDWVIIASISLITVLTLFYSVKFLLKPDTNLSIKHLILD